MEISKFSGTYCKFLVKTDKFKKNPIFTKGYNGKCAINGEVLGTSERVTSYMHKFTTSTGYAKSKLTIDCSPCNISNIFSLRKIN